MLEITNLEKSYGAFKVLRGLSMRVEKGTVYGFLGKNGSGKTTTINIICSILQKDGGSVRIGVDGNPNNVKLGYLPESPSLYGYMTPVEYLTFIAACCEYKGDIPTRINEVLAVTGLFDAKNRKIKGFSRGMAQRMGIAAAIFNDPDLLLLDEPTSALDPEGRLEVINIIERLKANGATIILSTHILPDVQRIADKVGIMSNGVIAVEGSIDEIVNQYQADSVIISLMNPNEDDIAILSAADFAEVRVSKDRKRLKFIAPDIALCVKQVLQLLSEKGVLIDNLTVNKPSLEEVYFNVVNATNRPSNFETNEESER